MEDVLLGSMSNTVWVSSSGCSRETGLSASGLGSLFTHTYTAPATLALNFSSVFPDLSPENRAEAQGNREKAGVLGGFLECASPTHHDTGSKQSWTWGTKIVLL